MRITEGKGDFIPITIVIETKIELDALVEDLGKGEKTFKLYDELSNIQKKY